MQVISQKFDLLCSYLFIALHAAQVMKVCRTPGPTACSMTKILHLDKVCSKSYFPVYRKCDIYTAVGNAMKFHLRRKCTEIQI